MQTRYMLEILFRYIEERMTYLIVSNHWFGIKESWYSTHTTKINYRLMKNLTRKNYNVSEEIMVGYFL